jgi:hypothetical protein
MANEVDALAKAEAWLALRANAEFCELYAFLEKEVSRTEGEAILADASVPTAEVRRKIIAWQERRKILLAIESIFDDQRNLKAQIEEDIKNERRIAAERANRNGW